MNRLARIVRSATPSTAVKFCKRAYGKSGVERFLRDVIALANAEVEGTRLIVVGVEKAEGHQPQFHAVAKSEFSPDPSCQDVAREFIEPPLRVRFLPHVIDGVRIGLIQISECHDRPYMMRVDHSAAMRRGDSWIRTATGSVRIGRAQLESIFAAKLKKPDLGSSLELGFRGDFVRKDLSVPEFQRNIIICQYSGKFFTYVEHLDNRFQ